MNYEKNSEWRLWLHALTPSAASLVVSFAVTVLIIGFHLLLLSNDPEFAVAQLAGTTTDDRLADFYSSAVQQPLDRAFGSDTLGVLSTVVVWGAVGWVLYAVADFIMTNIKTLRSSSEEITTPFSDQVQQHPLRRQMLIRVLWRFFIGLLFVVLSIALQPYIVELFQRDVELFSATSALDMLWNGSIVLIGWAVVFHMYVILFRLFVLRTRFFGEIIY